MYVYKKSADCRFHIVQRLLSLCQGSKEIPIVHAVIKLSFLHPYLIFPIQLMLHTSIRYVSLVYFHRSVGIGTDTQTYPCPAAPSHIIIKCGVIFRGPQLCPLLFSKFWRNCSWIVNTI